MASTLFLDHLLPESEVARIVDVLHRYPGYRTVGAARRRMKPKWGPSVVGPSLPRLLFAPSHHERADLQRARQRELSAWTGPHDPHLSVRGMYFRETYAETGMPSFDGIGSFVDLPELKVAASELFDSAYVVPCHVYANLFLPGQELHPHTDVPEFRGAARHQLPLWLLVVMHHSGIFERWRIPMATAVLYVTDNEGGGDLQYYAAPDDVTAYPPRANTGVMFDADSIFHGVARVGGNETGLSTIGAGAWLDPCSGGAWRLRPLGSVDPTSYRPGEVRFSVSWKAYCFYDRTEHEAWREGRDDLKLDSIVPRLVNELSDRGRFDPLRRPTDEELATLFIDEFVHVPTPMAT